MDIKNRKLFFLWLTIAAFSWIAMAWIDSRPKWDDTGITMMLVLSAGIIFGFLASIRPWAIALAVCIWIPITGMLLSYNYGGFLALIPGFAGAYLGFFLKKLISND